MKPPKIMTAITIALFVGSSLFGRAWAVGRELSQAELLSAVDRAMPALQQARLDIDVASAQKWAAQGAFDLYSSIEGKRVLGEYDNSRIDARLTQPLQLWGMDVYGGYDIGRGSFAYYDNKALTQSDGSANFGLELPLLKDRSIDIRRTEIINSETEFNRTQKQFESTRLSIFSKALSTYWDWAAAGHQLSIAHALLELAEKRDAQINEAINAGHMAEVERTDNLRTILQRRSALANATRLFEQKSIDLSMYYRGIDGNPIRPGVDRIPALPNLDHYQIPDEKTSIQIAQNLRPEIQVRQNKIKQLETELALSDNGLLPNLKLYSEYSRNYGEGKSTARDEDTSLGFKFSYPIQQRKALGSQAKAKAYLSKSVEDLRWAEDQIQAEVQDAISAVKAAVTTLESVEEELRVSRDLETLERDRFFLGDSTQLLVNIRELASADAAIRELRARADLQKAQNNVDTATARLAEKFKLTQ